MPPTATHTNARGAWGHDRRDGVRRKLNHLTAWLAAGGLALTGVLAVAVAKATGTPAKSTADTNGSTGASGSAGSNGTSDSSGTSDSGETSGTSGVSGTSGSARPANPSSGGMSTSTSGS